MEFGDIFYSNYIYKHPRHFFVSDHKWIDEHLTALKPYQSQGICKVKKSFKAYKETEFAGYRCKTTLEIPYGAYMRIPPGFIYNVSGPCRSNEALVLKNECEGDIEWEPMLTKSSSMNLTDNPVYYIKNHITLPDKFDMDDIQCTHGIHFYVNQNEM